MDAIFKALSDPHRRQILDLLRQKDGQTLSELEASFPEMTRFGVMKHLSVLEDASLVTTRKEGRFKYHYLNPVPLQQIADRWISAFAAPWARGLSQLKWELEQGQPPMSAQPKHVFTTIIQTTPEALWEALTNPRKMTLYFPYNEVRERDRGAVLEQVGKDGSPLLRWTTLHSEPHRRLVRTFEALWSPDVASDKPSRVTYEIDQRGTCCVLSVIHEGFERETATFRETGGGWPATLAGIKTLLETGKPLDYVPAPRAA
jgi:DNA-binding transcriptional ArsR family regulator/uncharacterized protein YndB with AHSA1/START domain